MTGSSTGAEALERLRSLQAGGRLAAEYSGLPRLLSPLAAGDAALAKAGRLLARLDPDEVLAHRPDTPAVRVAVTGSGTLGALAPSVWAEFARHGLLPRLTVGDYDSWRVDLRDPASALYAPDTRLALVVLDASVVFDRLPPVWSAADAAEAVAAAGEEIEALARGFLSGSGAGSGATLVLNTLPLTRLHTHRLVDLRSRAALGAAWHGLNARLLGLGAELERVVVLDLDVLLAQGGPLCDPRLAAYAGEELGEELLARCAREIGHLARALTGRTRKVLVLDLDNTLWDGVLGEDGAEGIAARSTLRGEAFGRVQRLARQLGSQGVLLAVCSKNDRGPVLEVLRDHPDMQLRETDFVAVQADWGPKNKGLEEIAERLGLGLESFVFADDSAFETGLVAAALPQVAVVPLGAEPALAPERLLADGWFDTLELTEADRGRTARYRVEAARSDLREAATSVQEYLRELGVRVCVERAHLGDVGRLAQLTQRTNQFNLTTERLTAAEVRSMTEDPGRLVLTVRSSDRFGDDGVVGALFARREADALRVENLLLSCRVLGRGIERAVAAAVLDHAKAEGLAEVTARYRATPRNHRVADFWPSVGFAALGEQAAEAGSLEALVFRHPLDRPLALPEHVRLDVGF
ncbi:HAD-IIIC family phosphatase [Streptacidiphilus neutrinimicus]|uniref:HAD-IIIC family phosphatase n=1 Tax=Streptacidiphilus neutrinimicus TaxID=105420 RepID=UPI0005A657B4|nr:HAD-IIIC family phosphatase [Streptacidiphilus neutrinimicus]